MPSQVAFLGPKGTYAEKAAYQLAKLEKIYKPDFIPCKGLHSVIEHVANKHSDAAVVPIENSVEGGVTATLDGLWKYNQLFIKRALVIPIRHALLGSGSISDVSEVLSHPQALAQCSDWLATNLPNAIQLPTNSTAEAVKMVEGSKFRAAIASKSANNHKGIKNLAFPINDLVGNCTRFVLLSRKRIKQKGNIASLAFSLHSNSPGALLEALSCIAVLGLNLSRIESRPSKRELGEYVFFIDVDLDNKVNNEAQEKLMHKLKPLCENLVYFGDYLSTEIEID